MRRNLVAACGCLCGLLLCASLGPSESTAYAQLNDSSLPEFEGSWAPTNNEDLSNDTVPVDYMGLPLSEEGRARALSYSESQLAMIERQCQGWAPTYLMTGPFGMKISAQYRFVPRKHHQVHDRRLARQVAARHLDGRQTSTFALRRAHTQRVRRRPLGGKCAGYPHYAHEGELHSQEWSAK